MPSVARIASPPARPVLVFDGDCAFCRRWIARWRQTTGEVVEYLPFQDPACAERFPELNVDDLKRAVHLVGLDGRVTTGAEAVFGSLAASGAPRRGSGQARGWLWAYQAVPGFPAATEWGYRLIADHRDLADRATTWLWGRHLERPSYVISRWLFLRLLALVYLAAFASLGTQIVGLIGSDGILPAQQFLDAVGRFAANQGIGLDRYRLVPTLGWISASNLSLRVLCGAGIALGCALLVGLAPVPILVLLWVLYLSLVTLCRDFLAFQWDGLLLEVGVVAIFLAPLTWRERRGETARSAPSARWLLLWLLFRLMVGSGAVKLSSGDPTWRSLTALTYHYWTQPLPTWIGWYADRLPEWFQQLTCAAVLGIELGAPFLIPTPRRLRLTAFWWLVGLQLGIALTGNYAFFNLLTIVLCVLLLDDRALERWIWQRFGRPRGQTEVGVRQGATQHLGRCARALQSRVHRAMRREVRPYSFEASWPRWVAVPLVIITFPISVLMLANSFQISLPVPAPWGWVYEWIAPFRSINTYGLFATMTTTRPEIIVEGSRDGASWLPYEFKYKPGDLATRPRFVAPHQPRLDWQMWFAALGECDQNPWLINFSIRLLEGSPDVLGLVASNPFAGSRPRYVRSIRYQYRFTDWDRHKETGNWWTRELMGEYCPSFSLRDVGPR